MGKKATWEAFDRIIVECFETLNKADFDMILAGFMSTTVCECSIKLQKLFEECILHNYGDDFEEFVMAANLIGKQAGRGNKKFWDQTL